MSGGKREALLTGVCRDRPVASPPRQDRGTAGVRREAPAIVGDSPVFVAFLVVLGLADFEAAFAATLLWGLIKVGTVIYMIALAFPFMNLSGSREPNHLNVCTIMTFVPAACQPLISQSRGRIR
jgi:hypothetical protein